MTPKIITQHKATGSTGAAWQVMDNAKYKRM